MNVLTGAVEPPAPIAYSIAPLLTVNALFKKNPSIPKKPLLVVPKAIAKPVTHHAKSVIAASTKFSASVFTTPVCRTSPASSMAKPHCIKNTRNPVISTQLVSMDNRSSFVVLLKDSSVGASTAWAIVGVRAANIAAPIAIAAKRAK